MVKSRKVYLLALLLMGPALASCNSTGTPGLDTYSDDLGAPRPVERLSGGEANGDGAAQDFGLSRASSDGRVIKVTAAPISEERLGRLVGDAEREKSKGKDRKSERLYKEALVIAESNEGSNHPDTAEIRMALANLYYRQDELPKAEEFYRRAIEILQTAYGDDDPRYAGALNNLAAVLYRQERYSDAEALYNRALKIFRSKLGPNHPHVVQTLTNLGKLHQARFKSRFKNGGAWPTAVRFGDDKCQQDRTRISGAEPTASKPAATVSATGKDAAAADLKKLTYSWDLDDDGEFEIVGPTVRFDAARSDGPHSRVIRVRISDDDGGSIVGSITAQITIHGVSIFDLLSGSEAKLDLMAKLLPRSEELTVLRKDPDATVISPPPKSPNTPSEVSKRYQIQLGAFSSEDIARREWRRIEKLHPGLVSTLSPNLIPVERGYLRTTIYRLQAGPLGKSEAAQSLCAKFKSQGQDCFVVKHDTD